MIAVVARDATTNTAIIPAVAPQLIAQKGSGTRLQIDGVMVCTALYKSIMLCFPLIYDFSPKHFTFTVNVCKHGICRSVGAY